MAYKNHLIENYKPSTVNSKILALNNFFSWCGYSEIHVKDVRTQGITSNDNVISKTEYFQLLETAKANKLKPYEYFKHLLTVIPEHLDDTDRSFMDKLLPWSDELPSECRKPVK